MDSQLTNLAVSHLKSQRLIDHNTGYTSYLTNGSVVNQNVGQTQPFVTATSTSTLTNGATPYISTVTGVSTVSVIYGTTTPIGTVTSTSYIAGNLPGFTIVVGVSGLTSGTVIIGQPVGKLHLCPWWRLETSYALQR